MQSPPERSHYRLVQPHTRSILLLGLLSLVIRLGVWWPVAANNVPPRFDEIIYFQWASDISTILEGLFTGSLPLSELARILTGSVWPPFNSFLLAIGLSVGGQTPAIARIVPIIISAGTTSLIYALTHKLFAHRAALFAAILHILHPSFITFSHSLWSETAFAALVLAAAYSGIKITESGSFKSRALFALSCGLCLALAGLTRSAVILVLFVVPAWVVLALRDRLIIRLAVATTVVVAWLAVLGPYVYAVSRQQGFFVPITTSGGYNFYLGNNPWVDEGGRGKTGEFFSSVDSYAELHGVNKNTAATRLAIEEIKAAPDRFLLRIFYHLRTLLTFDTFLMRHIFRVIYPPMPDLAVGIILGLQAVAHLIVLAGAVRGGMEVDERLWPKLLVLSMLAGGIAPSLITVAATRHILPYLALLLPLSGYGLTLFRTRLTPLRLLLTLVLIVVLWGLAYGGLGPVLAYQEPSSLYADVFRRMEQFSSGPDELYTIDVLELQTMEEFPSDHIDIVVQTGYEFIVKDEPVEATFWDVFPANRKLELTIRSTTMMEPAVITFYSTANDQYVILDIRDLEWRKWTPLGIGKIVYFWDGR